MRAAEARRTGAIAGRKVSQQQASEEFKNDLQNAVEIVVLHSEKPEQSARKSG